MSCKRLYELLYVINLILVFNSLLLPHASFAFAGDSDCLCIPVKHCQPFTNLLLHHGPHERETVFNLVKNAFCGFQGLDPLACCPNAALLRSLRTTRFIYPFEDYAGYNGPSETPWIWERRSAATLTSSTTSTTTPKPTTPTQRMVSNRFAQFPINHFDANELDVLDYKDFKTQRNCPNAFNALPDVPPTAYIDDLHLAQVARQYHYKYHIHHGGVADSDEAAASDYDEVDDRPIIFPDDLRFQAAAASSTTPPAQRTQSSPVNPPDCGISLSTRIIGGADSTVGQYPWLTRIAYRNKSDQRISYRCSGSVVIDRYVLTAAHCVINLVSDLELSHVRIGDDLSADCAPNASNCSTPNVFGITDVFVHPNYDQPKYANDIALLRLNINGNVNFTSICLPLNTNRSLADQLIGQMGVAAGWSAANMENANVKFLRLPIVNTTECAITYARYSENFQDPIVITPAHLCAQGRPMNDVCRGDSGGPFMDDGTSGLLNNNGRQTLLGIVAFGPTGCGISSIPGVYVRVSSYIDWIFSNLMQ